MRYLPTASAAQLDAKGWDYMHCQQLQVVMQVCDADISCFAWLHSLSSSSMQLVIN
jgi:hypothetical protein